jgi:hypothetical protein
MGGEIPIRAVVRLPDSTEVGFPVRSPRNLRSLDALRLTGEALHRQGEDADEDSGNGRDHRLAMTISHEKLPSKPANEMDVRQLGGTWFEHPIDAALLRNRGSDVKPRA